MQTQYSTDFGNATASDRSAGAMTMRDLKEWRKKEIGDVMCTCQRCFRLQQNNLRPGWSEHELLTPEHFQVYNFFKSQKFFLLNISNNRCISLNH